MNALRNLDIVVSVDTQDILDQIGFALHIDPIGRYNYMQCVALLLLNFDLESGNDFTNGLVRNIFTNQTFYAIQ